MKPHGRQDKTIVVHFTSREAYETLLHDCDAFRAALLAACAQAPETFPSLFLLGFHFHSFILSKKQNLIQRRVRLTANREVYQIRPSFMMPYMTIETEQASQILALRMNATAFWRLALVGGRYAMFWYRIYTHLGRFSLVGTTIKERSLLPKAVVVDEKHTRWGGEKAYIATTVADGCFLGAALCETAQEPELEEGYAVFAQEARELDPEYEPESATTDGWEATQNAWKNLFRGITLVLCFLHGFLRIRKRCRRDKELLAEVGQRVWDAYHAPSVGSFSQRLRRLKEWAIEEVQQASVREQIIKLCERREAYKKGLTTEGAHRTSNHVDRLMGFQDRQLFGMYYFSSTPQQAQLYTRAMAMLWNFHLYGPKTQNNPYKPDSPFEGLNGFYYQYNWLENFAIAASLQRKYPNHKIR